MRAVVRATLPIIRLQTVWIILATSTIGTAVANTAGTRKGPIAIGEDVRVRHRRTRQSVPTRIVRTQKDDLNRLYDPNVTGQLHLSELHVIEKHLVELWSPRSSGYRWNASEDLLIHVISRAINEDLQTRSGEQSRSTRKLELYLDGRWRTAGYAAEWRAADVIVGGNLHVNSAMRKFRGVPPTGRIDGYAEMSGITTNEDSLFKGIGTLLVADRLNRALAQGIGVRLANVLYQAQPFYDALGFRYMVGEFRSRDRDAMMVATPKQVGEILEHIASQYSAVETTNALPR